jgi:hypothetical protein
MQCPADHLIPTRLVTKSYNWNYSSKNWKPTTTVYCSGVLNLIQLLKSPVALRILIHMSS